MNETVGRHLRLRPRTNSMRVYGAAADAVAEDVDAGAEDVAAVDDEAADDVATGVVVGLQL